MDAKRMVTGTIVGGVTLFAVGYALFNVLLSDFYAANAGSATGVNRESQILWSVLLGNFGYAALITYAAGGRSEGPTLQRTALTGAVVGFLLWFTTDFIFYGIANTSNLTLTVVDPLVELIHGAIAGGMIGLVLGRLSARDTAPAYARA